MNNQNFDPRTDPVVIVRDNEGRVVIGDPKRVIAVTDLSRSEARELEVDVPRYFKTFSNPTGFCDYVFIAMAESNSDLISDREIRLAVGTHYDSVSDMIKDAEEYCLYSVDGDKSQLVGVDVVNLAVKYALAYHHVCGCVSEIYNSKSKGGPFDPSRANYLTKMGHVLKEMLYGTNAKVSI